MSTSYAPVDLYRRANGLARETWAWLLQRATAVLLLVFLSAHLWVLHFAVVGERITFEQVAARLRTVPFITLDSLLLAVVLFHALNGLRAVVSDFGLSPRALNALTWALLVVGLVTFLYGLNALLPFVSGQPVFYR